MNVASLVNPDDSLPSVGSGTAEAAPPLFPRAAALQLLPQTAQPPAPTGWPQPWGFGALPGLAAPGPFGPPTAHFQAPAYGHYAAPVQFGPQPSFQPMQVMPAWFAAHGSRAPWLPPSPPMDFNPPVSQASSTDTIPSSKHSVRRTSVSESLNGSASFRSRSASPDPKGQPDPLSLLYQSAPLSTRRVQQQQPQIQEQPQPHQQQHKAPQRVGHAPRRAASSSSSRHRCPLCARPFRSSSHLSRHRKSVHSDKKDFECRFGCGARFNRGDNRNMHEKRCGGAALEEY